MHVTHARHIICKFDCILCIPTRIHNLIWRSGVQHIRVLRTVQTMGLETAQNTVK